MEEQFSLDDPAQLALDVARHASMANGDSHCGTEYLLYGLVATARGEVAELIELFALNTLRVDRAIERLVDRRGIDPVWAGKPRLHRSGDSLAANPSTRQLGSERIFRGASRDLVR